MAAKVLNEATFEVPVSAAEAPLKKHQLWLDSVRNEDCRSLCWHQKLGDRGLISDPENL